MNGRQIDLSLFKASYQSLREGKKKAVLPYSHYKVSADISFSLCHYQIM